MKIEMWLDFTCPYSYLGKKRLDTALKQFGREASVEVEWKSFELSQGAADSRRMVSDVEMFMTRYEKTKNEALEMITDIKSQANEIGIDICLENMGLVNTFHAHRLIKYAGEHNKARALIDLLFDSYFSQEEDLGSRYVLQRIAEQAGLDTRDVDVFLCLNKHAKTVKSDEALAEELGITTLPFLIFNEEYAVAGIQPTETFVAILNELWREEKQRTPNESSTGSSFCTGDDCPIE